MGSSLPIDLRRLANHARICAASGQGMSAEECGRVAVLLDVSVKEADLVVGQAELMPELEDELQIVAFGLDLGRGPDLTACRQTGYQAALKAQQMELQRELDGGGPVHVSRPGLAALAMPIGDTNVVVMPIAPRPRPLGGGDAA